MDLDGDEVTVRELIETSNGVDDLADMRVFDNDGSGVFTRTARYPLPADASLGSIALVDWPTTGDTPEISAYLGDPDTGAPGRCDSSTAMT